MRFFIHEGKRKLVLWHCLCVLFDVNLKHIVWAIMESSGREAVMDSSLSLLHKETTPEIINYIELLHHIFPIFGLEGG